MTSLLMTSGVAKWHEDKIKETVHKIEDSKILGSKTKIIKVE